MIRLAPLPARAAPLFAEDRDAIAQGASGRGTAQFPVRVGRDDEARFAGKPADGRPVRVPAAQESIRRENQR